MARLIGGNSTEADSSSHTQNSRVISEDVVIRALFGGAMATELPQRYADVCEWRQVPDHQEVWVETHPSQREEASSVIIELLEMTSFENDHGEPARYHFWQLADENEVPPELCQLSIFQQWPAMDAEKLQSRMLPADVQISIAVGVQACAKFNQQERDIVCIYLGLIRLPSYRTDILITLNQPYRLKVSADSVHQHLIESSQLLERTVTNVTDMASTDHSNCVRAFLDFQRVLQTLVIHDYTLFNNDEDGNDE